VEHLLATLSKDLPEGLEDPNGILTPEMRTKTVDELVGVWKQRGAEIHASAAEAAERLRTKFQGTSLAALNLTTKPIGDCEKTAACGMWALTQGMKKGGGGAEGFKHAITAITREGGDADTNATVAGALMGAALGFQQLPQDWVSGLLHGDWLRALGEELCTCLMDAWQKDDEKDDETGNK
jgi:hypothetical protein